MNKLVHLLSVATIYFLTFFSPLSYSEQIEAGFEPFPPLINEDGSGLVVDMLSALSEEKTCTSIFMS